MLLIGSEYLERNPYHWCHEFLSYLVPTAMTSFQELVDLKLVSEALLHWEGDLPLLVSLGNELRRWSVL